MLKGLCAFKGCKKPSEVLLTIEIVKDMGGKLQESKSVVACYCESHGNIMLQERKDTFRSATPTLQKIDDLNNNITNQNNNNSKGNNEQ